MDILSLKEGEFRIVSNNCTETFFLYFAYHRIYYMAELFAYYMAVFSIKTWGLVYSSLSLEIRTVLGTFNKCLMNEEVNPWRGGAH